MKRDFLILMILFFCISHYSYCQIRKVYNSIESKNVLYYKVEEIVNMVFGGSTTRYTVSNLSLISRVDLGSENIRIITPVYKEESYKKKYYIETKNLNTDLDKTREPTQLLEITIESGKIEIPDNPPLAQSSLALVISKLVKIGMPPVVKNESSIPKTVPVVDSSEPQKEKRDYILVNVVYVYERVLEKGYRSIYMLKQVANYYYFKNQMDKAAKWYDELFNMTNDFEPVYYFRFGDALIKTGKTERGNVLVEKFNQLIN